MRHDEEQALHVTALLACACSALVFEAVIGLILVLAWLFARYDAGLFASQPAAHKLDLEGGHVGCRSVRPGTWL
jgi:hypothetical protein